MDLAASIRDVWHSMRWETWGGRGGHISMASGIWQSQHEGPLREKKIVIVPPSFLRHYLVYILHWFCRLVLKTKNVTVLCSIAVSLWYCLLFLLIQSDKHPYWALKKQERNKYRESPLLFTLWINWHRCTCSEKDVVLVAHQGVVGKGWKHVQYMYKDNVFMHAFNVSCLSSLGNWALIDF